jgi:hypothetical protein
MWGRKMMVKDGEKRAGKRACLIGAVTLHPLNIPSQPLPFTIMRPVWITVGLNGLLCNYFKVLMSSHQFYVTAPNRTLYAFHTFSLPRISTSGSNTGDIFLMQIQEYMKATPQ